MRSTPALDYKKTFLQLLLLFGVLAVFILYGVKGWRGAFFTSLADHWDTKLMGEWMAWNAHNILRGHFLVPDFQANFFYPHSYTLAFGEMLWPESFVYAGFYLLTGNLFFSFNATMLFFWALSGVVLFVLLRMLNISVMVSALGSLVYCLMPYRMSYYIEFNMVLVFVIPLMMIVLLHWLRAPSIRSALWFCLGYLVSVTSCIYFTIMAIIIMVFVFVAFLASHRELLRSREFYVSGALLAVGVLVVSAVYLYPYAVLHFEGGYERSTADYLKYFAQPIHYVDTNHSVLTDWIKMPIPRPAETILFPGAVLGLMFLLFLGYRGAGFFERFSSSGKSGSYIAISKFVLWAVFWSVILVQAYFGQFTWLTPFDQFLYDIALVLIGLYIVGLFVVEDAERSTAVFLAGLCTAAVVSFFISLGPIISIGQDADRVVLARGPFLDLASWNPLFNVVRGLTRFSIVVLTYLTVAGCFALDRLVWKNRRLIWVLPVLAALSVYDARVMLPYRFIDDRPIVESPVMKKAQHLPGDYVLLQLPADFRPADASIVMASIGRFPLLANGWSGFSPDYYEKFLAWEKADWNLEELLSWAKEVWPPVYLIVDRGEITRLVLGWKSPFPVDKIERDWEPIGRDERYILYRQKPVVSTAHHIIRRVRTDMLKEHPLLSFTARSTGAGPVNASISVNGVVVKERIDIAGVWKEYTALLPAAAMGRIKGDEVGIDVAPDPPSADWQVKNIEFRPKQR